jgi:hypothetical protein
MPADDFIPDFDGSDVFVIFNRNHIRRTDIRAGSAPDAEALDRYDKIDAIPFFHFERTGADDFIAYPDA